MIVSASDFVGVYSLPVTRLTSTDLDLLIDEMEVRLLRELLGVSLADLFIAEYPSLSPRFTAINDVIVLEICGVDYFNEGLKKLLIGFIYVEYMRGLEAQKTSFGVQKSDGENSLKSDMYASNPLAIYNKSVKSSHILQTYILDNLSDYPEFKGQEKQYNDWLC